MRVLKLFFIGFILLFSLSLVYSNDLNIKIRTDKYEYVQGEMINLSLEILNYNNFSINTKLSGKIIVGDFGINIKCFEIPIEKNSKIDSQLLQIQATLSNSNSKQMTEIYNCGGVNSKSNSFVSSNGQVALKDEELFNLGPLSLDYSINGTDKNSKSNTVEIVVKKSNNQNQQQQQEQEQQNQEQNQNQQEQNQNGEKNSEQNNQQQSQNQNQQNTQSQGQQSGQQNPNNQQGNEQNSQESDNLAQQNIDQNKGEKLDFNQEQALKNNQQNSQSLNNLKNEISKISVNESKLKKLNQSFNETSLLNSSELEKRDLQELKELAENENRNYFGWFLLLLLICAFGYIYYKYFNKKVEVVESKSFIKKKNFEFNVLLDLAEKNFESDYKKSVKYLAQSVRSYLKFSLNLENSITNNEALKLTKNKVFVDIIERAERVEFARGDDKLDIKELVKVLRKNFKENLKNE